MSYTRLFAAFLCCVLLLGLMACNDDDCPVCPEPSTPTPTLANIWPHADGNAWVFDLAYEEFENPLPAKDQTDTADAPSMEDLHAELQAPMSGSPVIEVSGMFRMAFDGEVVTESGVTAQRVRETMFLDLETEDTDRVLTTQTAPDRLLQLIACSRPDLRDAIVPLLGSQKDIVDIGAPIFLGGYAFSAEDDGYFSYGDLDMNHSWTYLSSSLDIGTEFTIQLLPAIADDLWLNGRIWSRGDLVVNGRTFENVVECMYMVDLGEQNVTNESGEVIGTVQAYSFGTIHYAPEVGPVMGRERHYLGSGPMMEGNIPMIRDYVLNLVGATGAD